MKPVIRRARSAECEACLELWLELQQAHVAIDPRYRLDRDAPKRWRGSFREWVRSDAHRIFVAADPETDKPFGIAVAHPYIPPPVYKDELIVHVDDLFVRAEHRGKGIARELLDAISDWAREMGAIQVRAGVLATNPGARAFWERAGATDFAVTVVLDIE